LWVSAINVREDTEDPEQAGQPFRLIHLSRVERKPRLIFDDPERRDGRLSKRESIVKLQDTSVHIGEPAKEFKALLVRPHPQFELQARGALELVAERWLKRLTCTML
jgi:hypothetical protein